MLLTHLPKEILLQIISLLPSPHDIAALSLQCHHLHSLCDMKTRKKYRRIRITNDATDLSRAFTFLIRILKQPTLGQYIRHIELYDPWVDSTPPGYSSNATLNEEHTELIRAAIQNAGFPPREIDRLVGIVAQVSLLRKRRVKDGFREIGYVNKYLYLNVLYVQRSQAKSINNRHQTPHPPGTPPRPNPHSPNHLPGPKPPLPNVNSALRHRIRPLLVPNPTST